MNCMNSLWSITQANPKEICLKSESELKFSFRFILFAKDLTYNWIIIQYRNSLLFIRNSGVFLGLAEN